MTTLRITGLAALSLLVGLIIVAVVFNVSGNQPVSAAQLLAAGEAAKQELIDGTSEGKLLYIKSEDYYLDRIGFSEVPDNVILETWMGVNDEGLITTMVSTMSTVDGIVVQHGQLDGTRVTITDVGTGRVFGHNVSGLESLANWLDGVWQRPATIPGRGFTDKGEGTYKEMSSQIYERPSEIPEAFRDQFPGTTVVRIEIVESAPLFLRQSTIREDASGERVVLKSNELVEATLLPAGSAPPSF